MGTVAAGQYDDGLTSSYEIGPDDTPRHIQFNGIRRMRVHF